MTTKTKTVRQRVQFAFNADLDSAAGTIFQYLIKNHRFSSREGKRKGVDAMVAFYKPFAYQGNEAMSEGELQDMARDAVEILSRQVELLCSTFGVDRPEVLTQPLPWRIALDIKAEIKQTLAEVLTAELFRVHQEPSELPLTGTIFEARLVAKTEADEGIDIDEDALLGDLYSNAEAAA